MPQMWTANPQNHKDWAAIRLDGAGAGYALSEADVPVQHRTPANAFLSQLIPDRGAGRRGAARVLIAGMGQPIRINGMALTSTGIHVLEDRDEIVLGQATRLFFSNERLAQVVACPPEAAGLTCPRCKKPLEAGKPAVRCPGCPNTWYHEDAAAGRNCWTWDPQCVTCRGSTAMDAGYRWTPHEL